MKKDYKGNQTKSFGPLRILVVRPSRLTYFKAVAYGVAVCLVHLLLGAINMIALLYTMFSNDKHVILCSVAFHFFSAEAIMSLSPFNGWAGPMNVHHRTLAHVLLQSCALICVATGATMILLEKETTGSAHTVSSILTLVFALLCLGTGPCALARPRYFSISHVSLGMPTFIAASISLSTGLFMPKFDTYFNPSLKYILLAFVVYSTTVITVIALRRCLSWL